MSSLSVLNASEDRPRAARLAGLNRDWGAWLAWAVWLAMFAATLGFVGNAGLTIPFADEWQWVSRSAGHEPVTPAWLWSQHNEHRPVLPRLVYLALARLTNHDFRAASFLSVVLLAAAAATMMLSARALRGRASAADAFFPLFMLNWGQFINLLWGFQLCLVMATVLACAGLLAMLHARTDRWLRWGLVATGAMAAASLSAASGLAYLAALAVWLVACVAFCPSRRADRAGAVLLAVLAIALAAVYRIGFQMPNMHVPSREFATVARTALEFLANAFGPVAAKTWPASAVAVALACAAAAAQAVHQACTQPARRLRAISLLGFLLGTLGLGGAIGWSRSFLGAGAGFEPRYVTLAMPLVCLFFLQAVALPTRGSRAVEFALVLAAALLLGPDTVKGLRGAACLEAATERMTADARAGVPPEVLAVRYNAGTGFGNPADMAQRLEVLRQGGWGPYRGMPGAAIRPALDIAALAPLATPWQPSRIARLGAGEAIGARLFVPTGTILERVDLLAAPRHRHGPKRLRWQLLEIAGVGSRELASGEVGLAQLDYHEWLSITFPPLAPIGTAPLDLRLAVDARDDCRPLEIPLYALAPASGAPPGASSFQGHVYFTPGKRQRTP